MELHQLLKTTRQYFWQNNFDEVEINYLNKDLPLEPNLYAFETIWRNQQQKFYLPTSPEFSLKQHLATQKLIALH
jgi:elongation factor P--beta-lysine ligase